jgi:hypothetical protein
MIQSLTEHIQEVDDRISALEAEAMQFQPLEYIVSQRKIDRLVRVKRALLDEWNNAMSKLAICRSTLAANLYF